MTIIENNSLNQSRFQKDNGFWLVVMDVENILISLKKAGLNLSFKILDDWVLESFSPCEKVAYLDIQRENGSRNALHRLGWTLNDVITKYKNENRNSTVIVRNAIDLDLALDTLEAAYNKNLKGILLFGGDGDYMHLVKKLKGRGISVVVSAVKGTFSEGLKRLADEFFYLDDLATPKRSEKKETPIKQQDENALLDDATMNRIQQIIIKKLKEMGGSIPLPSVLSIIWKNTGARCLRDLGIKKSKHLKREFPSLFKGIEIQGNILKLEESK